VCHAGSAGRPLGAVLSALGADRNITLSICFDRITDIADVLIDMEMGIVLGLPG
jgi:hypothetical protein